MCLTELDKTKLWIGVDLDGTLAELDLEKASPTFIGQPIKHMVDQVKEWHEKGIIVKIFTARVSAAWYDEIGLAKSKLIIPTIIKWCEWHLGFVPEITAEKDHLMMGLVDDMNLYQVERNTGRWGWRDLLNIN